jgi:hypothetical protein
MGITHIGKSILAFMMTFVLSLCFDPGVRCNGLVFLTHDVTPGASALWDPVWYLAGFISMFSQTTRVSHHHPPKFPNCPNGDDLWVE